MSTMCRRMSERPEVEPRLVEGRADALQTKPMNEAPYAKRTTQVTNKQCFIYKFSSKLRKTLGSQYELKTNRTSQNQSVNSNIMDT